MPVTKTTAGLIFYDECDSATGYEGFSGSNKTFLAYTDTKHSGSGCLGSHEWNYYPNVEAGQKAVNLGYGNGRRIRVWHKVNKVGGSPQFLPMRFRKYSTEDVFDPFSTETSTHDWTHQKATIDAWQAESTWWLWLCYMWTTSGGDEGYNYADHLVISQSDNLTITGLVQGQKAEVYRSSDNALIGSATCAAGQTSVSISLDSEDYPLQCYLKVYATNGTTLIETTSSYEMCGGDSWAWTAGAGTLTMSSDVDVIYRQAATGTPKTANVVANLKTGAGGNYPGASILFTTVLGSVSPTSDTTDASGNAHTALTSTGHGLAVVKANWLGDASVPACSAYYVVHVFYEAEAGDSSKDFQFYAEGIEYTFVSGRYTLNEIGAPNDFEVELSDWVSTITPNGLVNIYRLGVKEFHGILEVIKRSILGGVKLKGPDVAKLLNYGVADTKIYSAKTPQYMINDLLTSFPCGITVGTLGVCAASLTITIETETLQQAIARICELVHWHYRVDLDRKLDFAESFTGGISAAEFEEGVNIIDGEGEENYYPVANWVRMRGNGITSTKQDGTKISEQGLLQMPAFNKTISDQATLDTACQALLDMKKTQEETIPLEAWDQYAPGTFGPEDYVTVTSPTAGLSGTYQIRKIERNLTDAEWVKLDLSNRTKTWWELDEIYRRMTKDVSI